MEKNTKIIVALAAGALAGFAIGMLLAPEKGSETRKIINDKSKSFIDELLDKANEIAEEYFNKDKKANQE